MATEFAGMMVPETLEEKLAARSALVVVDLQNDFVHPDGYCAKFVDVSGFAAAVTPSAALVGAARARGVPVYFTAQTQRADGSYSSPVWATETLRYGFEPLQCIEGTWGSMVTDLVAPKEGDVIVPKTRRSGFHATPLAAMLRARHVTTVVVCGVAATGCVESTVRGALEEDFFAVVAQDCIGDAAPELEDMAVTSFRRLLAPGDLTTSMAITRCWDGA